jgi:hypothetical protein
MNLRNAVLTGLGLPILLFGDMPTQAQTKLLVPKPPSTGAGASRVSSSLGGPITPTQPNFFDSSSTPLAPPSLSLDNDFATRSPSPASETPVAPIVGDPPRTSRGGIINIKTD